MECGKVNRDRAVGDLFYNRWLSDSAWLLKEPCGKAQVLRPVVSPTQFLHISMQAAISNPPVRSRSSRFVMLVTSMRHLSFSVLLHFILVVIFGTAAIYRVQDDAPEFVAET